MVPAVELAVGIELCGGDPDADGELGPYNEFQAFVRDPGMVHENVEGSGIASLSRRQTVLAFAWHYAQFAGSILGGLNLSRLESCLHSEAIHAMKLKLAARKSIEDDIGRGRHRSASTRG